MFRPNNKKVASSFKWENSASRRVQTENQEIDDKFEIAKAMKKYKFNLNDYGPSSTSITRKTNTRKSNGTSVDKTKQKQTASNFSNVLTRNFNYNKSFYGHEKKQDNKIHPQQDSKKTPTEQKRQHQQAQQQQKVEYVKTQPDQTDNSNNNKISSQLMVNMKQTEIKQSDAETNQNIQHTYQTEKAIGSGSFGTVYKAKVKETGQTVAIKKVLQDKRYKNRELQILKELHHPNVLQLVKAYFTNGENSDETYLHVVMDYIPETIYSLNRQYIKSKQMIPNILVKLYSYQIIRSLAYIHSIGICHRDIKPHNILVDPQSNKVVMCDFGSAKRLVKGEPNIAYICSRCYRAPELIFGATNYTTQIDVWSTGCVIAEMINGEPLFIGDSAVDQLVEIIKVLGTPAKDQVLQMNPQYDLKDYKFPQIKSRDWKKVFRNKTEPLAIDLLSKLLVYSPQERLTPLQALAHPYFDELRDEGKFKMLSQKIKIPNLFDYSTGEIQQDPQLATKIIPEWYYSKHGLKSHH